MILINVNIRQKQIKKPSYEQKITIMNLKRIVCIIHNEIFIDKMM